MRGAYAYVAKQSDINLVSFSRDVRGSDGSLRTYSTLQEFPTKVLNQNDNQAICPRYLAVVLRRGRHLRYARSPGGARRQ